MSIRNRTKAVLVIAVCAIAGSIVGIAASAGASTHQGTTTTTTTKKATGWPGWGGFFGGGMPIHGDRVVLNDAGTAWITQTVDAGTVSSVSGNQLAVKEGTTKVPYKTVTLTIPSDASIVLDGAKAALSDLKADDSAYVVQSSDGTSVIATDGAKTSSGGWGPHGGYGPGGDWGPGGGTGHGWGGPFGWGG